jgi:hypothetical protein
MARKWVYGVKDERRAAPATYRLVRKGEQRNRWVTVSREDVANAKAALLQREVKKAVAELTPAERERLARVLSRPERLTRGASAEDRLALAGIIEHGDTRAVDFEREDGSTTLIGGDSVTRLDLSMPVEKRGRTG